MKQPEKKDTAGGPTRFLRTASFWALIVLIPLAIFQVMDTSRQVEKDLTYSEFRAQLDADNVVRVTITEGIKVEGELRRPLQESGVEVDQFNTLLPTEASQDLLDRLEEKGVEVEAKEAAANWVNYLISVLPWILIIGLWFFFFRQMQAGGSRATRRRSHLWTSQGPMRRRKISRRSSNSSRIRPNSAGSAEDFQKEHCSSGHREPGRRFWRGQWPARPIDRSSPCPDRIS